MPDKIRELTKLLSGWVKITLPIRSVCSSEEHILGLFDSSCLFGFRFESSMMNHLSILRLQIMFIY